MLKRWIKWVADAEWGSVPGKLDFGGLVAMCGLLAFSGIYLKSTKEVVIFEYTEPSHTKFFFLGLILIVSIMVSGGHYAEVDPPSRSQ